MQHVASRLQVACQLVHLALHKMICSRGPKCMFRTQCIVLEVICFFTWPRDAIYFLSTNPLYSHTYVVCATCLPLVKRTKHNDGLDSCSKLATLSLLCPVCFQNLQKSKEGGRTGNSKAKEAAKPGNHVRM